MTTAISPRKRRPARKLLSLAVAQCLATGLLGSAVAADIVVANGVVEPAADGQCSLVEAFNNANGDNTEGSTDCTAGSGDDTVILPSGSVFLLDNVAPNGAGRALPVVDSTITVQGNGAQLTGYQLDPRVGFVEVAATGYLTLEDVTLAYASSGASGGAIAVQGGRLKLDDSRILDSRTNFSGGAIHNVDGAVTLVNGSLLADNSAGVNGGGLSNFGGTVSVTDSSLTRNSAGDSGGGISNVEGRVTLNNSSNRYGVAGVAGGGIANIRGSLTLMNESLVSHGYAEARGGGIYNDEGTVVLRASTINYNSASGRGGGGIFGTGGRLTVVEGSSVSNNYSYNFGGGIYQREGVLQVFDSDVSANGFPAGRFLVPPAGGGGIFLGSSASLELRNSTVTGNQALEGGGIAVKSASAVMLADCTIANNLAYGSGGGAYITNTDGLISNCVVASNTALGAGGGGLGAGLYVRAYRTGQTFTVSDSTIRDNEGGGIDARGGFTLNSSEVSGNSGPRCAGMLGVQSRVVGSTIASNRGGGLCLHDGELTGSFILNNTETAYAGGGLSVSRSVISGSVISGNQAPKGGGVDIQGGTSIYATTIDNNKAELGGGVWVSEDVVASLQNVTFSGNSASLHGGGIAVDRRRYGEDPSSLNLDHVTLANNVADGDGQDFYWSDEVDGSAEIRNSILAGGPGGDACVLPGDPLAVNRNNLIGDSSCATGAVARIVADPQLLPLADNGGPTRTHATAPTSPAIDSADPASCLPDDQRGVLREPATCDRGAFEQSGAMMVSASVLIDPDDGECSLAEAILNANTDGRFSSNPGECGTGLAGQVDRIVLPAGARFELDAITTKGIDAGLPTVTDDLVIEGNGASLVRTGGPDFRLMHNQGSLTLIDLSLSGGSAPGDGGALLNEGALVLRDVTLADNQAAGGGGAIANQAGATATLANSTLSGNRAEGAGGALLNAQGGGLSLLNVTFALNESGMQGSALGSFGKLGMVNTLIAGDNGAAAKGADPADCFAQGGLDTNEHNLVQDGTCDAALAGDGTPLVGPLADNGGDALTHALVGEGNPAVDGGNPEFCLNTPFDQRGAPFKRSVDGDDDGEAICDIGAFELDGEVVPDAIFRDGFE